MGYSAEDWEQIWLMEWCEANAGRYPELKLIYHIPNEGKRTPATATKMKRMGLKAGVPDIFLPVAKGGKNGLYLELKAKGGRTSQNQREWIHALREQGYVAEVCFGWHTAAKLISGYLGMGDLWNVE